VAKVVDAYRADPYSYREARALARELRLTEPVAVTLVRRGYRTPEAARAFLAADETHPPGAFESMGEVVEKVLAAARGGRRITVHGDFDVDGVCATSVLVGALRRLGADCDWLIPDRIADGYGLCESNVRKLAERGTSLLITVDCGITAVAEVALARSLGMEAIVTDHHQPAPELPDCPILHPTLDCYPFPELCGTAVAWKLACALQEASGSGSPGTPREREPGDPDLDACHDLDLVALATVADLVPLVGENRALVRRGLEELRRAQRPGLRALLDASGCEPAQVDEGDLAFRLAPRINAAGRLYRADAGVELLLGKERARAVEIAAELDRANGERKATQRRVEAAAQAALRKLPDELREAPGLVLAGEGWHPGVIGIVASHLAEHRHRPVVVVSLDGEGGGRGSGRSVPGFDLLAALDACSEHLVRFGGHRAAAGLELRAERLDDFRRAFAAHASAVLGTDELRRTEQIDAMAAGAELGLDLAEELKQLAPFGMGNPAVRLLVPSARVGDVRTMGEGKHARFSLRSGAHRALGVAFGRSTLGVGEEEPVDAAVRLEVNRWNGSEEPRVVLRRLYPLEAPAGATAPPHACRCPDAEWWERFEAELHRDLDGWLAPEAAGVAPPGRETVRGDGSAASTIAELVSSGDGVLAVCADASRRAALASGATGLARFNGGVARVVCFRCGREVLAELAAQGGGGLALTDYQALAAETDLAASFEHVVLVDPPPFARDESLAGRPGRDGPPGFLHPVWSRAEHDFSRRALGERFAQRDTVGAVFRGLREAGEVGGEGLRRALEGASPHPRSPETAARCLRVLNELGLVRGLPDGGGGIVGVVSSKETDLERSAAFRAYTARHREGLRYLEQLRQP
jgi:single-stranded-DNA-specific exonuclease